MYCYAIESEYIDKLISGGKIQEAKEWFNTWRYIDDMLGFGSRNWQEIDYGMEHTDTTDTCATQASTTSEAVFLGMRIRVDPTSTFSVA